MPSVTSLSVAEVIRLHLRRRKMHAQTLAESIGMGQRSLSKRLVGAVPFKVDELLRIADVLDVPVQELCNSDRGKKNGAKA